MWELCWKLRTSLIPLNSPNESSFLFQSLLLFAPVCCFLWAQNTCTIKSQRKNIRILFCFYHHWRLSTHCLHNRFAWLVKSVLDSSSKKSSKQSKNQGSGRNLPQEKTGVSTGLKKHRSIMFFGCRLQSAQCQIRKLRRKERAAQPLILQTALEKGTGML